MDSFSRLRKQTATDAVRHSRCLLLLCHPNDLMLLYEADVFLMDFMLASLR